MLPFVLMSSVIVGGFPYTIDSAATRTKTVATASQGGKPTWTETIRVVVPSSPADRALKDFLLATAEAMRDDGYGADSGPDSSFATTRDAGWLEVDESVLSASPDIVSLRLDSSSYSAGMPHPEPGERQNVNWSRRLHRRLVQSEVLATLPDRALRLLALARYDNRAGITVGDFADGLPLDWDHASIGPAGITWSFGPYDLGGYPSGGSTTIGWTALKPYLAKRLPFDIGTIRAAPKRR